MKYEIISSTRITPIKKVKRDGYTITNPTDSQLDEWGVGYYLETTVQPTYDPQTQYVTKSYSIISGKIKEVWTINDIPVEPEITASSDEMLENLTALGITNYATESDLQNNLRAFGITNFEKETT